MATDIEKIYVNSTLLPSSSTYQVDEEDLSSADAGRTEDGKMHKMRIGTLRSISLSWKTLRTSELTTILNLITDEYLTINFFDPRENTRVSAEFYVGNRTMAVYNGALDVWQNLSFKFIERAVR